MTDFLEVKAKRTEIASGFSWGGSALILVDIPADKVDNDGDGQRLADWLWRTVPYMTLDFAIKELERREKNEEEEE